MAILEKAKFGAEMDAARTEFEAEISSARGEFQAETQALIAAMDMGFDRLEKQMIELSVGFQRALFQTAVVTIGAIALAVSIIKLFPNLH